MYLILMMGANFEAERIISEANVGKWHNCDVHEIETSVGHVPEGDIVRVDLVDRPASKFTPIINIRYTVLILWFRNRPLKCQDPCVSDTRSSAWPSPCHA